MLLVIVMLFVILFARLFEHFENFELWGRVLGANITFTYGFELKGRCQFFFVTIVDGTTPPSLLPVPCVAAFILTLRPI